MTKQQAQQIIRDTFESSFDKNKFTGFIKNLLNRIEDAPFTYRGSYIPDAYKQYIKTLERIGKFSDGENNIDILVITLQKETSLERARTMQRNFVAWYLNGSRGGVMKDAALAAFVSPDKTDWRFSLVKMEYKFEKTKTGKVKVKEEFTPARRWSFLVGANEKSHTAQSSLVKILANDEQAPTLQEIEKAFDIETVTKEFFLKYRELFLRIKEELDRVVKNDTKVEADFNSKGVDTVNFAKKLLGQIIFLYFLQKKGWFGVERDADWGEGSKHFMRELFESKHGPYKNFFNDILEPLFYDALSRDRSDIDHWNDQFKCKIPFLNGGLFDPIGNYSWYSTDILLPDKLFSNTNKTKEGDTGDGILDIFDLYNFTVKEDEPLEKEVAIDPELLGKAYEKFNAIRPDNYDEFKKALKSGKKGEENKFNKKFGVYYTPREIVHYMCQQSLINYLATELDGKASKEDIETLIHIGEHISENEVAALIKEQSIKEGKQKTSEYKLKLTESIRKNAALIDDKLADITVCDPAVGSGAFPVGMMQEIVRARNVLSVFLNDNSRRSYEFKRRCIEHSLYGVDIDPGAVEIAKLRLWLSLVVDEDDIKNIKPLPNLEYKIVRGNSLIGFPENWDSQISKEIEELKHKFFSETNTSKKIELKKHIDDKLNYRYENSLKTFGYKIDFDFKMVFSEVFHQKGGFDVVIANPPYLKERDNRKVFESANNSDFGKKYHQGKMDYWYYFLHKAIDVVRKEGIISYITSRYWLNSSGAKKLIQRVKNELSFIHFIDIGKLKVFDEVAGHHMVAIYQRQMKEQFIYKQLVNDLSDIYSDIDTENVQIKFLSNKNVFCDTDEIILDKSFYNYTNTINLGAITDITQGVVQNPDKVSGKFASKFKLNKGDGVFVLTKNEFDQIELSKDEMKYIKYFYDEIDYSKYRFNKDDYKILIYITKNNCKNINKFPGIKNHLICFKKIMDQRRETKKGTIKWFQLHWPRNEKYFNNNKIVIPSMFRTRQATYVEDEAYFGLSTNIIIQKNEKYSLKYIVAILNSKFAEKWFYLNGKKRGAGVDIGVQKLRQFPIKNIDNNKQKPFIALVNTILATTESEDYTENPQKQAKVKVLEAEIDQMVYQLYDLTPEEIKIVEGENENAD